MITNRSPEIFSANRFPVWCWRWDFTKCVGGRIGTDQILQISNLTRLLSISCQICRLSTVTVVGKLLIPLFKTFTKKIWRYVPIIRTSKVLSEENKSWHFIMIFTLCVHFYPIGPPAVWEPTRSCVISLPPIPSEWTFFYHLSKYLSTPPICSNTPSYTSH